MPGFATRSHTRAEDSFLPQLVLQGENSFVSEMRRLQYCNSDLGTLVEFRADGTEHLQQFEGQGSWLESSGKSRPREAGKDNGTPILRDPPWSKGSPALPGSLHSISTQPGNLANSADSQNGAPFER